MRMLLEGEWVERDEKIEVRDPYDNSLVDTVPKASEEDLERALAAAVKGFEQTKSMPAFERANILGKTAFSITENLEGFARVIAREGSKTIREARIEVARAANAFTVAAEESKRILGETISFDSFPGGEQRQGYYCRLPLGVILAITPFNDPLNLVAHKLAPALAAGNAVILKPATLTPLSALKLADTLLQAGLPPLALQVVTGSGADIGDRLVGDARVRMVSFTGGTEVGKRIARTAGIKKIGMELGSNSPVIVWRDADIAWAARSCVSAAFWAAGQNCIGVQRIHAHDQVYEEFRDRFVDLTSQYQIGDKLREETDMGPMITEEEAVRVERWVKEAVDKGARTVTGGSRHGTLFAPTVLENVPTSVSLHCQEAFGPTVNLYRHEGGLDEAIHKANSLPYGIHAAIFTNSLDVALEAARELDSGGVMINDSTDYRLDSMPFGGVKLSGLGREGIKFALRQMTETKVICFYMPESSSRARSLSE
ncbi:MAG: aldehyde dehydrogenase family protein [Acidobacteriota bacterium]